MESDHDYISEILEFWVLCWCDELRELSWVDALVVTQSDILAWGWVKKQKLVVGSGGG